MTYYVFIENKKITGCGQCRQLTENVQNIEVSEGVFNAFIEDNDLYIYSNGEIVENPDYKETKRQKERQRLDLLTLTPSDVERALLAAKGMDFDDLKAFLKAQGYTDLQIKAVGVELRANNFFRGATLMGTDIRIVDTIGGLLGYSSDDMDYLFEHKQLPSKEQ